MQGYIPGNVRIISWRANNLRSDANLQELLALVKDAKKVSKRRIPMSCDHDLMRKRRSPFRSANFVCRKCGIQFRRVTRNIFAQRVRGLAKAA